MATREEINCFESRYKSRNTPWDSGKADKNLKELVQKMTPKGSKALEVGCGTGDNAIFMAKLGFSVAATEIAPTAFQMAAKKAEEAGVKIAFWLKDIMEEDIPGAPFDIVFDRGCFHHFNTTDKRKRFAKRIYDHLGADGKWISLIGNADEISSAKGPPRLKAAEIVQAVEPFFEIFLLKSSRFDSNSLPPPRCWVLVAKRRKGPL